MLPYSRVLVLMLGYCLLPFGLRGEYTGGATAVVVGISDFEDPAIADLRFADRDAEAFSAYLSDDRGGGLSADHIRLLTNGAATLAAIESALSWQLSASEPGGVAYLYLATHGDIEAADLTASGYLLAHDTPFNNYNLLALGVDYLNEHLTALAEKDVQAILITDACHAGSLAGNAVAGRRLTAAQLMAPLGSEVRLLSCQPYEFSYESERWGGGRGVFSYHLVRALGGAADEDLNRRIDLYELEQFVQHHVSEATDREQHPEVVGGRKDESPFPPVAEDQQNLLAKKSQDLEASFEETQLALAPRDAQQDYVRFRRALDAGAYLLPEADCALAYYRKLRANRTLLPLRGLLDDRLTVALLDSVQQAIQDYLDADTKELLERERLDEKYLVFPRYLAEAADILGEEDPRYRGIEAKQRYFEGLNLRLRTHFTAQKDSLLTAAEAHLREAVRLAPEAAYMHNELGIVYEYGGQDSLARLAYERAQQLAPTWALPYNNLSNLLWQVDQEENFARIVDGYERAIELRPDLGAAYMNLGILYRSVDSLALARDFLRRAVEVTPGLVEARYNLASMLVYDTASLPEAIDLYRSVVADRPKMGLAVYGMGYGYEQLGQLDSAIHYYLHALTLPDSRLESYLYPGLARIYARHRVPEGRAYFSRLMRDQPRLPYGYAYSAMLDTTSAEWSKTLAKIEMPEEEHFNLIITVAGEMFHLNALPLAVEAAQLGAKLYPRLTVAHRYLADILLVTERWDEAEDAARRALSIARKNGDLEEQCRYVLEVDLYDPLLERGVLQSLYGKHCPEWKYPPNEE
ncbi:caspase family protein [Neolewinella litorea]|uniref:Tetratricopeptide repeat protein n=1 Tax=Neolewinella litorea TaxID=2562452 RepID=A0A4S4NJ19_9BACT|nr:tetratricopeptide repeat protein [Neolewinella litorea]THH39786.1 tetratricopeptide repeat protein [Neolewinella litorea]